MRSKLHKGINIWSFDQSRSIEQCMRLAKDAGFEGIELAMAKDGPLGLTSSDQEILAVKALAQEIGIQICSLATGLYWQYSLTANPPEIRAKAKQVVRRQIDMAALLGNIASGVGLRLRSKGLDTGYTDLDKVADYARSSVVRLRAAGILEMAENYKFNPQATLNRGEMAQIVATLLSNL